MSSLFSIDPFQLSQMEASLNEAATAIDTLYLVDVVTMKTLARPSEKIKMVGKALCILFKVKPMRIPDPANPSKHIEDYWGPTKKLLSNSNFINMLIHFDRENIEAKTLRILKEEFFDNPQFTYEEMLKVSKAAAGFYKWIKGTVTYSEISKQVTAQRVEIEGLQA